LNESVPDVFEAIEGKLIKLQAQFDLINNEHNLMAVELTKKNDIIKEQ
jgi:hypothetical protein